MFTLEDFLRMWKRDCNHQLQTDIPVVQIMKLRKEVKLAFDFG